MLHKLYQFVQRYAPGSGTNDEPAKAPRSQGGSQARGSGSKPKKNKPMSKTEQEARINELQGKLKSYQHPGAERSPEPCKQSFVTACRGTSSNPEIDKHEENGESSSDDDESGSESEEE